MLIKAADDKQPVFDALTALLTRADLDIRTRAEIEQEIRSTRAGAKGERDAAYEIEFRYANNRNIATIHDLRVECNGRTAQIDHLIINRLLQIWVCESKHFADGVSINDRGEWERLVAGHPYGMPSPVEQNRKHIAVLEDIFRSGLVTLPRRPGYAVQPELRSLILVSNSARIQRPRTQVDGLDDVIKCEQLGTTIEARVDAEGVIRLLGKAALKLIRLEQLVHLAEGLAALHRPLDPLVWATRFTPPDKPAPAASPSIPRPFIETVQASALEAVAGSIEQPAAALVPVAGPRRPVRPAVHPDASTSPERLLADLNTSQREAVQVTSGPLAILAGAGSGKTRVVSRRAAYAIETGAVEPGQILLVTFTDKAAGEMAGRMASLGHPRVMARTFHAAALAQLRHFWPTRHAGADLPRTLTSKLEILAPLARRLPGGYRFTPAKDLADVVEWAKVRRIPPEHWIARGLDRAPIPPELFSRLYRDYERAKTRAGRIDFEDMLVLTVELLEADDEAAATVRSRKRWFCVDEYQDTNPLAERLLELWLGDSRDVAVVGDPDQTIYTFTGASPEFLLRFAERHPGARTITLAENYRSTPQVLALANRLIGPGPRGPLRATKPSGAMPTIRRHADAEAELGALVAGIRSVLASGVPPAEVAVLVRINAQLPPIEDALTRAGIGFLVRGQRFFERTEVRQARHVLARARLAETGEELPGTVRTLFEHELGLGAPADDAGAEARERAAALDLLLGIVGDMAARDPALTLADVLTELDRRDATEAAAMQDGVNLLTYHRAKGLEWDAVFLPALEEGLLPVHQAKDDDAIAEERRLLYVGITRARLHLALSWAARRATSGGKDSARRPSRFMSALDPRPSGAARTTVRGSARLAGTTGAVPGAKAVADADRLLLGRLQNWRREKARRDGVPAYVVAEDATLAAIAEARPRSSEALGRVRGIGPVRLERYGAEILALVGDDG